MKLVSGAWPRSKHGRRKLARTVALFLAVASVEGVLVAMLELTGPVIHAPQGADNPSVPYYLTTERLRRPTPKTRAAERRPEKKRKPEASPVAPSPPQSEPTVSPPGPTVAEAPPAPDYGRWTVAPGASPEAGRGRIAVGVCDPANLASLPPETRKACLGTMRTASVDPPARRGAAPDWKDHGPLSCAPKYEPGHKLLFEHCQGLGVKYKF